MTRPLLGNCIYDGAACSLGDGSNGLQLNSFGRRNTRVLHVPALTSYQGFLITNGGESVADESDANSSAFQPASYL